MKLKQWMGTARWTYNQCVNRFNETKNFSLAEYRKSIINNVNYKDNEKLKWVINTPYEIRDQALIQFQIALKSARSNYKAKNIKGFKFTYLKRKFGEGYIVIRSRDWKDGKPNPTFWKPLPNLKTEKDKKAKFTFLQDMKLIQNKHQWFICSPYKRDVTSSENQGRIVSIDPGIVTFLTCYDNQREQCIKIGDKDIARLKKIQHHMDKLKNKYRNVPSKKRYKYKRAWNRMQLRIQNLTNELHKKACKWLCTNYNSILLGNIDVKGCVKGKHYSKNERTKNRGLLALGHGSFREKLLLQAEIHNVKVILVDESYTSQTCGQCGKLTKIHTRIHTCTFCNAKSDRDVNGARNIEIKYRTQNQ